MRIMTDREFLFLDAHYSEIAKEIPAEYCNPMGLYFSGKGYMFSLEMATSGPHPMLREAHSGRSFTVKEMKKALLGSPR